MNELSIDELNRLIELKSKNPKAYQEYMKNLEEVMLDLFKIVYKIQKQAIA